MAPDPTAVPPPAEQAVVDRIDRAARRAAIGRSQAGHPVWSGLGMAGLVGWSVTVPTVLGTLAGIWLDHHHPGRHSWTLSLLVLGLTLGCLNAWRWLSQQSRLIAAEDAVAR